MGEPIKRTKRGFGIYAELTDTYEAGVSVIESSSADRSCVWIYVEGGPAGTYEEAAAHLDFDMAVTVRDALSSWIENVVEGKV